MRCSARFISAGLATELIAVAGMIRFNRVPNGPQSLGDAHGVKRKTYAPQHRRIMIFWTSAIEPS